MWTDASIMEHYKLSREEKQIVEDFGKDKETEPKETEPKETEPKETEPKETEPKETKPKETKKPKQTKGKKGGAALGKKRTRKNKGSMWKLW